MMASVITPTCGRDACLPHLYRCFLSQTHEDKELLILDDSPEPSASLAGLRDPRVRYWHSPARMTIGAKRDRLIREAAGDVIVHFDDDDFYAARYLETMAGHLAHHDLVKLSGWYLLDAVSRELFYWDTSRMFPVQFRVGGAGTPTAISMMKMASDPQWSRRQQWGYGFSLAYHVSAYHRVLFDSTLDHGEDYCFVERAFARNMRVHLVTDQRGIALHIAHPRSTSYAVPNYRLPSFLLDHMFGSECAAHISTARQLA